MSARVVPVQKQIRQLAERITEIADNEWGTRGAANAGWEIEHLASGIAHLATGASK